jgi:seryl-tRNA synthetase
MHDINFIRQNPEKFDNALQKRGLEPISSTILELDKQNRALITQAGELQSRRNEINKTVGMRKKAGDDATDLMAQAAQINQSLQAIESKQPEYENQLRELLISLPNILQDDVPVGKDENDNKQIKTHLEPNIFNFTPKAHYEIGEQLGLMDFEAASKISGARFTILKGELARLERALGQFMLDTHTANGYTEVIPPVLVRDAAMFGTGNLPKFAEDSFSTTNGYWLTPTAEVTLTNMIAGDILSESDLPLRYCALTPCFRSEAGSAGRDTRGMLRQHQFNKVELVSITTPEKSKEEHERKLAAAESILQALELPYRIMLLCSGDSGFSSSKTYDIEVWLPAQNTYREISSVSNCGDFQARRMNARFRPENGGKKTEMLHTLNGSGLAVGRSLIAVMENYQQEGGSIAIPSVLQPYMGKSTEIICK